LLRVTLLEELGGDLEEPLGINGAHLAHVLLRRLHQLVVDHPLRSLVEKRRARVDEHLLVVANRLVPLGGVLATAVVEEARADRLADLSVVLELLTAAGDDREAEALHDLNQLLANVLAPLHCPSLNEVFIAPLILEAMHLPGFVNSQHSQVVAVFVVELCSFLVCKLLFLARSVEDILDGEHRDDSDDLVGAAQIDSRHYHFGQLGFNWKLGHKSPQLREQALIVEAF